jgi:hypothetical protein
MHSFERGWSQRFQISLRCNTSLDEPTPTVTPSGTAFSVRMPDYVPICGM